MKPTRLWLVPPAILAAALVFNYHGAVHGQTPPPPPPPANPPTLSPPCPPVGCPTATPAPTATLITVPVSISALHKTATPGKTQEITVTTAPGAGVSAVLLYPNGNQRTFKGTAPTSGKLTFKYKQPGSRITRYNQSARINCKVGITGGQGGANSSYKIGFAHVDVGFGSGTANRTPQRGKPTNIWLHTSPHAKNVYLRLQFSDHTVVKISGKVGVHGWWHKVYKVPQHAPKGHVDVRGYATIGKTYSGETSFVVH